MKTKYLSLAQAAAISKDYQHLCGGPFDEQRQVALVTAAPYSRILQWQYIQSLLDDGLNLSPATDNPSGRFDVLVVSRQQEEPGFLTKDLRSYLRERGLPFDEARYACLRRYSSPPAALKHILG